MVRVAGLMKGDVRKMKVRRELSTRASQTHVLGDRM